MHFEHTEVWGFEHAIRGMRNPMESRDKSDSGIMYFCTEEQRYVSTPCLYDECPQNCESLEKFVIGDKDLELMQKLIKAGSCHRKFMRQIMVSVDITAPLYWWKEFDTYKVGTTANSTSTMHKLASTPITMDCFEMDDSTHCDIDNCCQYTDSVGSFWVCLVGVLEELRQKYNETKDKKYWKELIRLLPESWLQTRTCTLSYENLLAMCSKDQRRNHKLTEWSVSFIQWARTLPYAQDLLFGDEYSI